MHNQHVLIQSQSETIQSQQASISGHQISNTHPLKNQTWSVPTQQISQQLIQYQLGNALCTNVPSQQLEPVVSEANQTRALLAQQVYSLHNLMIGYGQAVA